jgi:hypothetical protein
MAATPTSFGRLSTSPGFVTAETPMGRKQVWLEPLTWAIGGNAKSV